MRSGPRQLPDGPLEDRLLGMDEIEWTTFEHPQHAYRLEYPKPWECLVQKDGADCGFGPRDRDDVGLWISMMPMRLDTDRITDELPKVFRQVMGTSRAANLRADESLRHPGMKSDLAAEGEGGHFWLLAGGDLVLFASTQVPEKERGIWNPLYDRVMASLVITRDDELLHVQVVDEIMKRLQTHYPDQKFTQTSDGIRGEKFHVYLSNVYREVHAAPERLKTIVDEFVAGILASAPSDDEASPGSEAWEDVRHDVLPIVKPLAYIQSEGPTQYLTYFDWLGEVIVCYAIHRAKSFRYLTCQDLDRWKLSQQDLHDRAIKNLNKLPWPKQFEAAYQPDVGRSLLIHTGDNFEASRILHPDLHRLFRTPLGSPFLAAIPNRDTLVAFTEAEQLHTHIEGRVRKDYDQSAYPISRRLFLVTPDGVALV